MEIKRIYHIGITVKNLEKTVKFYRDILGLKMIEPPTKPCAEKSNGKAVGVEGAVTRICLFEIAKGHVIEFLEYQPESPIEKPVPMNALGAHHVALLVDDIDAYVEKLKQHGVEFLYEPLTIRGGYYRGVKWVYFKDPDGIIVELMEETE